MATTGSARYLAGVIVGADLVKNEITCHAVATLHYIPQAQTIIEIGGQDSKIIIIRDGIVTDFGMNTVCAAGTGSFLDHQALRLNMTIEEFSQRALNSQYAGAYCRTVYRFCRIRHDTQTADGTSESKTLSTGCARHWCATT